MFVRLIFNAALGKRADLRRPFDEFYIKEVWRHINIFAGRFPYRKFNQKFRPCRTENGKKRVI